MMSRAALAAVLSALVLSACSGGQEAPAGAEVSSGCEEALRAAAAEPDDARADPLLDASLTACSDADEWLAALRRHPAALGLTERANIDGIQLRAVCRPGENDETPVCADAYARGILTR